MSSWNKLQEPKALPRSTKLQFVLPLIPSLPPLVVTCLWLILDCSQKVPLVNDANKRHSLALLISPVSPLSIKQSFILPTNDYNMYILKSWGRPKDIKTWEWVIYHFNHLHSLLRNSCFPRGKTSGQCTKEPPSHKSWIGNLWLGSRQPVQLLI